MTTGKSAARNRPRAAAQARQGGHGQGQDGEQAQRRTGPDVAGQKPQEVEQPQGRQAEEHGQRAPGQEARPRPAVAQADARQGPGGQGQEDLDPGLPGGQKQAVDVVEAQVFRALHQGIRQGARPARQVRQERQHERRGQGQQAQQAHAQHGPAAAQQILRESPRTRGFPALEHLPGREKDQKIGEVRGPAEAHGQGRAQGAQGHGQDVAAAAPGQEAGQDAHAPHGRAQDAVVVKVADEIAAAAVGQGGHAGPLPGQAQLAAEGVEQHLGQGQVQASEQDHALRLPDPGEQEQEQGVLGQGGPEVHAKGLPGIPERELPGQEGLADDPELGEDEPEVVVVKSEVGVRAEAQVPGAEQREEREQAQGRQDQQGRDQQTARKEAGMARRGVGHGSSSLRAHGRVNSKSGPAQTSQAMVCSSAGVQAVPGPGGPAART